MQDKAHQEQAARASSTSPAEHDCGYERKQHIMALGEGHGVLKRRECGTPEPRHPKPQLHARVLQVACG